jgi:hypothetical protein
LSTVQVASVSATTITPTGTSRVRVSDVMVTAVMSSRVRVGRLEVMAGAALITPPPVTVNGFEVVTVSADIPPTSATPTSWEWTWLTGPAVTLVGAGATVSFLAPALEQAGTLTLSVRALINGRWSVASTVVVNIRSWPWWGEGPDGTWTAHCLGPIPGVVDPDAPAPPAASRVRVSRLQINSTGAIPEPPPAPTDTPTPGMFFKMPSNITQQTRKIFPHYFPPYPLSLDNAAPANDYYERNYLNPLGESSSKAATGGLLRDRPWPTTVKPAATYVVDNAKIEIQMARDAGIDGYCCEMLGFTGNNWTRAMALRDAAVTYFPGSTTAPPFYLVPMIDGNGAHGAGTSPPATIADPVRVAASINQFANRSCTYLFNGKMLVGTFRPENPNLGVAWWQQVKDACLTNHGISIAYAHAVLNYGTSGATFDPITDVASVWGIGSDPAVINAASNLAATARARGRKWMQPIQPANIRPGQHWYDEAGNTGAFRAAWAKAVRESADFIQYVTWSDFSEGGQTMRSVQHGRVWLDLGAYYMTWWKTGVKPAILRDAIYLSHRNQLTTTTPLYPSSAPMVQRAQTGRTTARNTVEVLTFLTAPATITVNIGSNVHTYTAPAGEFPQTFPMVNGAISVSGTRGGVSIGSITSPVGCMADPPVQDLGYFTMSSLRPDDTAGMYVPTNLDGVTL